VPHRRPPAVAAFAIVGGLAAGVHLAQQFVLLSFVPTTGAVMSESDLSYVAIALTIATGLGALGGVFTGMVSALVLAVSFALRAPRAVAIAGTGVAVAVVVAAAVSVLFVGAADGPQVVALGIDATARGIGGALLVVWVADRWPRSALTRAARAPLPAPRTATPGR
jgi:hypothetical protein